MEKSEVKDNVLAMEACREEVRVAFNKVKGAMKEGERLETLDKVLMRNEGQRLVNAMDLCLTKAEGEAVMCQEDARRLFKEMGNKRRKFGMMQSLGLLRTLAALKADCLVGNEENDCMEQVKERFIALSGAEDEAAFYDVTENISTLAGMISESKPTTLQVMGSVEARFGFNESSECSDEVRTALLNKLEAAVNSTGNSKPATWRPVVAKECRVFFGQAFYRFVVQIPALATASAATAEAYVDTLTNAVKTAGRRLQEGSASELYVAQEVKEVEDKSVYRGDPVVAMAVPTGRTGMALVISLIVALCYKN